MTPALPRISPTTIRGPTGRPLERTIAVRSSHTRINSKSSYTHIYILRTHTHIYIYIYISCSNRGFLFYCIRASLGFYNSINSSFSFLLSASIIDHYELSSRSFLLSSLALMNSFLILISPKFIDNIR